MRRLWIVVIVAVGLVALRFAMKRPVAAQLDLDYGASSPSLREANLVFTDAEEHVTGELTLKYPSGAPAHDLRGVRLRKGSYTVGARLVYAGAPMMTTSRALTIGEPGTYTLDLSR